MFKKTENDTVINQTKTAPKENSIEKGNNVSFSDKNVNNSSISDYQFPSEIMDSKISCTTNDNAKTAKGCCIRRDQVKELMREKKRLKKHVSH